MAEARTINPAMNLVNDWTDWQTFGRKMYMYTLTTIDHVLWSIISVMTVIFMTFAGTASFCFAEPLVKLISPRMTRKFIIQGNSYPPSLVSSSTPNLFSQYTDRLRERNSWESLGPKLCGTDVTERPPWDVDVARFMLHLCALTYEHPRVATHFANEWGLECLKVLRRDLACYVYYSTQYPFVIIAFKGTSPFDLSEWLTDVMMLKVRPSCGALPGQVHEGFYNSFQWDAPVLEDEEWAESHQCDVNGLLKWLKKNVLPKVNSNPNQNINVWVTGHSLGGALATVFLSHLTYREVAPFNPNVTLRAAYTFGSPKVGDTAFADATNHRNVHAKVSCFRVVNGNDAVPALPFTSSLFFTPYRLVLRTSHGKPPNLVTDFKHVGEPICLGYDCVVRRNMDRTWLSIASNTFGYMIEWPRYFYYLAYGRESFGGLISRCLQPFPYDHAPSEYNRHLSRNVIAL